MYPKASNQNPSEEEVELGDDELGEERVETSVVRMVGKDYSDDDEDEDEDENDSDDEDEDDTDDEDTVDYNDDKRYNRKGKDVSIEKPRKKKLKTLISNYEFAPRMRTPPVQKDIIPQRSSGGQIPLGGWSEVETFALLDACGARFLRIGKKSFRNEGWKEVSGKVSQETNIERTGNQCRNRLDTLKKKYKKEKERLTAGESGGSKWVYYEKMDTLLSTPTQQQTSLSCGIDSGKYVFSNPNVYLNHTNGLDEMRDSPANSENQKDEEEDSEGLPPKPKRKKRSRVEGSIISLLADSIQKFSEIYEKIESNKMKQIQDLENMRMDFCRQIETQKREIWERAQTEIVKIRRGHDAENVLPAENQSG